MNRKTKKHGKIYDKPSFLKVSRRKNILYIIYYGACSINHPKSKRNNKVTSSLFKLRDGLNIWFIKLGEH